MAYLQNAITRIITMQRAAISVANGAAYNADAVPFFFFWQESFPYFTNRITQDTDSYDSEDYTREEYTITMRFVVGHLTEGVPGQMDGNLFADVPLIKAYFKGNPGLTVPGNASYLHDLDLLAPELTTFEGGGTLKFFQMSGIGVTQIGTEFTLTLPFIIPIVRTIWS